MDRDCSTEVAHSPQKWILQMTTDLNDEIVTDELADEAISLMKKLPTYIVNNFIATGYDTLDVIADLTKNMIYKSIIANKIMFHDCFNFGCVLFNLNL